MNGSLEADIVTKRGIPRIFVKSSFKRECNSMFNFIGFNEPGPEYSRYVELNAFNMRELRAKECVMGEELTILYRRLFGKRKFDDMHINTKLKLYPFQVEGAEFLHAKRGRALLADEMGLGKTPQVIALLSAYPEQYTPTIIICPAHIKLNWLDEFEKFWKGSKRVEVIFGTKVYPMPKGKDIIVINQHLLKTWVPTLTALKPKLLVIDEAHTFVSKSTKTYDLVEQLARATGRTILLSGSPLVNKADDLWGLCNLVSPHILGGYTRYLQRFCPQKHANVQRYVRPKNNWGRSIKHKFQLPEEDISDNDRKLLHRVLVSTIMLRRMKVDVATQLPKIIRKVMHVKVEDSKFWKAEKELLRQIRAEMALLSSKGKEIKNPIVDMKSFSRMRQIVSDAKLESVHEWIDTFLSESKDDKLVVVGWHKDILGKLHDKYPNSYLITGDVPTKKKHVLEKEFQAKGGPRILFGNIKSIGSGINLTAAHHMLFVELPYTGVDLSQVEARIHRLSQLAKFVIYNYIIVKDSLEDRLLQVISEKQKLAGKIIDNKDVETIEEIADSGVSTRLLKSLLLD